ncbi:MAG: hypothetical protein U9Q67_02320, partial [Patescibacteria group bacterium]|nr:hypothetical protein [Patescibacteria group bacterium]
SPFVGKYDIDITLPNIVPFDEQVMVYKAEYFEDDFAQSIMNDLDISHYDLVFEGTDIRQWSHGDDTVYFNNIDCLLVLKIRDGLRLDIERSGVVDSNNAAEYFMQFANRYLSDFPETNVVDSVVSSGSVTVYGDFVPNNDDNISVSSIHLGGHSVIAEFSDLGDLKSLSILLVSDLTEFQEMPVISSAVMSEYISMPSFPKLINVEINDDDYQNLPVSLRASVVLNNVDIESVDNSWIFVDSNYSYIIPAYRMTGTGLVLDPSKNSYDANVELFVCALDPHYLSANHDRFEIDSSDYDTMDEEVEDLDENLMLFDPVGLDNPE